MDKKALIEKAELTLADITTNGGLLFPEQSDKFIRTLQEQPSLLQQVRVDTMRAPVKEFDKIQFASRILVPASQADQSATGTSPYDGRYLPGNKWAKPVTSKVTLTTVEQMAEIHIPYEVLEDNIEGEQLRDTIMALAAAKVAEDMEDSLINADTSLNDGTANAMFDGVLKQATSNTVDIGGDTLDPFAMTSIVKAMPQKFRSQKNKFFITPNAVLDLRLGQASRNTPLGDASLRGQDSLMFVGGMVDEVQKMPIGRGIYTDPKNIIVGIHRNLRIEVDRDIRAREVLMVMTIRWGVKILEELAFVKFQNAAS